MCECFTCTYGCARPDPLDVESHDCEQSYGCWEWNSGSLEEQLVLLTPELCLQQTLPVFVETGSDSPPRLPSLVILQLQLLECRGLRFAFHT